MIYSHLRLVGGLSIFFLVLTIQALAQATLLPIQVKGLWGYIDGKGQIAIKPQFQNARGFSDGLAAVSDGSVNGKCGYINDVGHLAIDVIFAHCGDFYGGLAAAETGEKFGYINTRGSFVIPPQWQSASGFSDEMARVTDEVVK